MRPHEVGEAVLSYSEAAEHGARHERDSARPTEGVPESDLVLGGEDASAVDEGGHKGLPDGSPPDVLLPAVLVHGLLVQLQQQPGVIAANVQDKVGLVRNPRLYCRHP